MQYSLLGRTGLAVSRLAFGAMTFTAGNRDMAAGRTVGPRGGGPCRVMSLSAAGRHGSV